VIIPARNASATLPATLEALERQVVSYPFEVLVVDDGSTDATPEQAGRSPVVTRVIRLAGTGPGIARNTGAGAAAADRLAFLDADCRPTDRWLQAGLQALEQADLVLGETRPEPDQPPGPFDRTLWVSGLSPLFESANLFVRRGLFETLGGFESWLGPRDGKELGEDVWFGWRARRSGARLAACPEALAYHAVFTRGPAGFAAERWRLRFFPALAARVPELRREFFYRRVFLSRRSAAFDAALLGAGLAAAWRDPRLALALLPYARMVRADVREGRARAGVSGAAELALARAAADAVGAAAMALGSARSRSLLL
jgi:glycosyltransferase involved in cell wall biosynthesis